MFRTPPSKGSENVIVKYSTRTKRLEVTRLKVEAKYHLIVSSDSRRNLDMLMEKVMKAIYQSEKSFEEIGVAFKPVYGKMLNENQAILSCLAELELKLTRVVPTIERIEIRESRMG
jgi:hypothetical protein